MATTPSNRRPVKAGSFDLLKKALVTEGNAVKFRQGKVISYNSSAHTIDVQIGGATDTNGNAVVTTNIKLFGNFTPDVDQAIWLVTDNIDIFAIGQLAPYGGATGSAGADGRTILNGTTAPSLSIGQVGDFYINTATWEIYGPRTSVSWGSPTYMIAVVGATAPITYNSTTHTVGINIGSNLETVAGALKLTDVLTSIDGIKWDTANPITLANAGEMTWNTVDGTLDLRLGGNNVTLQVGQEQVIHVKDFDNGGLTEGKAVYLRGSKGANILVSYAKADAESTSSKTLGVLTESASGGAKAYCTTFGLVRQINTSALTEGAIVWLSPSVAGGMTTTIPIQPHHATMLGLCVRSHATEGVIFVKVQNWPEINELSDVLITSPQANEVLRYDSATGLWKNSPSGVPTGGTAGQYLTKVNGTDYNTQWSTLSLPSGIVTTSDTGTVTSTMIADGTIVNADINASAEISATKVQGTLPTGGTTNQVLAKSSGTNYATTWVDMSAVGAVYQPSAPATPQVGQIWVDSDASGTTLNQNDYFTKADASLISTPVGSVTAFAGTTEPSNWKFCYGQELPIATYTALYNALTSSGTVFPYGANTNGTGGVGSTHFRVPDMRGRTTAGRDDMGGTAVSRITSAVSGITATTLGATGGDQRLHAHSHGTSVGNDSPDHTHSISDGRTFYGENSPTDWGFANGSGRGFRVFNPMGWTTGGRSSYHSHSVTISNNTEGGVTQNIQPTIILNYIIKVA